MSSDDRPILVTSALPYANGPLHFGHIAGAYLPADIYVRYHRLKGSDVVYICGTDEHGVAITRRAEEANQPYQEYVNHWFRVIKGFFDRLDIEFDNFSQTSRKDPHYPISQEFFERLDLTGHLGTGTQPQHFCPQCQRFLPDRFVEGTCYICHAEQARGDECKKCGTWLEAIQLIEPRCARCGTKPEIRDAEQWFLKLEDFAGSPLVTPWLEEFRKVLKPNVHSFVFVKILEQEGLKSRAITRDLPWGVPIPEQDITGKTRVGIAGKVLYVWFDAPIGYVSSTIEWARDVKKDPELWRKYWIKKQGEKGPKLVNFIGKDNIPFHCVVFPAMLAWQTLDDATFDRLGDRKLIGPGRGEAFVLPENVPANEFYNLEDRKFNTSEGWYIDIERTLGRFDVDQLRYYLVASMPETADTSFQWREFQKCANKDLADVLGNLASRVLRFIKTFGDGRVPSVTADDLTDVDRVLLDETRKAVETVGRSFEEYKFKAAAREIVEIGRRGNRYIDETQPWVARKQDPKRCDVILNTACQVLRSLAVALWPIVPRSAEKLWDQLGLPGKVREQNWSEAGEARVPGGLEVRSADPLFTKVPDEVIEDELALLAKQAASAAPAAETAKVPELPPAKPTINYDDFTKLDVRVGKILAAEPVPKAKRLLKLSVDTGLDQRTVVAGIAEHYKVEELIGRKVIVLVNLEPRALRGVESQGMLLAADLDGRPFLLSASDDAPVGSPIK